MKTTAHIKTTLSKGFTLIELLIVIAVLGVLAAATLAAIDPVDKIRAGNDSKVISDVAQIGRAAEAYAASNGGTYPAALGDLVTSGELKNLPTAPATYSAYAYSGGADFTISGQLRSKKYTATQVYKYTSASGKACAAAAVAGNC